MADAAAQARAAKLVEIAADGPDDAARREAAMRDCQAAEYQSRPRWEDYRIPGQAGWADTPDPSRQPENRAMREYETRLQV